jgi:hypothetical protein
MELINLNSGSCGTSSTISLAYSNPFYSTTNNMETEELWDFLWVYIGEEDEEDGEEIETFPHEGRVFGTKSDVEKSLLVEFARLYTEVDVEDYELKLRKW